MHLQKFDPYDFSSTTIEGVPVYYKNLPWAPCLHIYVVFNTGAFDDPEGKEGLSHFLEHMIFNGSPTLPHKKDIRKWSKVNALNSWNAWTSHYSTAYHLECLPETYSIALSGMKDMIFNSYLRTEDVEHERSVITQEAWGRYKNQKFLNYVKEMSDNVFHGHEHARISSPLGWPETVEKISQEDINNWHKEKYIKSNAYIVVVGAVIDNHIKELESFVQGLPEGKTHSHPPGSISKAKNLRIVKRADEIGEVKEQVEISIFRATKNIEEERFGVITLFRLLAHDILFENLRTEKGLCYGVKILNTLEKDYSQFVMTLLTDEKNIEHVQSEFWKILQEIEDGVHLEKFNTIKKTALDQIRSQELLSEKIVDRAVHDITRLNGKVRHLSRTIEQIENATYEEVANFTKEIFDKEYTCTEIILPSQK